MMKSRAVVWSLGVAALLLAGVGLVAVQPGHSPGVWLQTLPESDAERTFVSIEAGRSVTCGVTATNVIRCWGNAGSNPLRAEGYTDVAATVSAACGLRTDGAVDCWAASSGSLPRPPAEVTFKAIDGEQSQFCGIQDGQNGQTEGLVKCWTRGNRTNTSVPAELASVTFSSVSAYGDTACGLVEGGDDDGKVKCWDSGVQSDVFRERFEMPEDIKDTPMSSLSVGRWAACALVRGGDDAGKVRCWGIDWNTGNVADAPVDQTFISVKLALSHACGLKSDKTVTCWGSGIDYQDAQVNYGQVAPPGNLSSATFSAIALSHRHTCGLLDGQNGQVEGAVKCWGAENFEVNYPDGGDLYDNGMTRPFEERPLLPKLSSRAGAMSVALFSSCALTEAGGLACWGVAPPPIETGIAQVSGKSATCALKTDGTLRCWGQSSSSARGLTFRSISVGWSHGCGILDGQNGQAAGTVKCWGSNSYNRATVPGDLASATFGSVAAGFAHTCGILDGQNGQAAGTVKCWGDLPGNLNVGQAVAPDGTFVRIDAGYYHNCGILDGQNAQAEGSVYCWGWNRYGQSTVTAELADDAFADVSAAVFHSCGATVAGRVACWGASNLGQSTVPEEYKHASFAAVAAAQYHSCGVTIEGYAACWGADADTSAAGIQIATSAGLIANAGQADPRPPAPGVDAVAPKVMLVLSESPISENQGSSTLHAELDRPAYVLTAITVMVDPPASSGIFGMPDVPLVIPPGRTTSRNAVAIIANDNDVDEPDRVLRISGLASDELYGERATNSLTLIITDDDGSSTVPPRVPVPPTPVPTPVATPVRVPVPPTPVPTPVATPVPTPVATPVPTPVATPVPTPVPTPVATPVPTPVATPVPTPVPTPVATPVPTPVPTPVATPVPTLPPTL